ncbi:hypothetical protein EON64_10280 [archaeon]|nr:MAG: hypothetical protein EON64_10280 [archaeon]
MGSRAFLITLLRRFLEVLGVLWLCLEPVSFLASGAIPKGWATYLMLVVTSFAIGLCLSWPRGHVSASVPGEDVEVTVKVGDIFDAQDNVVIGTNDVFDTEIGDVISSKSVQGQFLTKRFGGNATELDNVLSQALEHKSAEEDKTKTRGKNRRYSVGTTVVVPAQGVRNYLCAYCRMRPDLKAESTVCELIVSLEECWELIRNTGQNEGVSMPVLGSEFARLGLTQTRLIQIIVLSFLAANRNRPVAPSLTIYVYPGKARSVDFSALRMWLRGVLWA